MSDPCLYGPTGLPISSKFLKAAENGNRRLPSETIRAQDPLKKLITRRDWQTVSFLGDKIDANFGVSEAIVSQKAMFAVTNGWLPIFYGGGDGDKPTQQWADIAIEWLIDQWFPFCDVRGPNFDFNTGLYMDSVSIDARGDAITLLTRSEAGTGRWPMIQRIPNRQIGQWDDAKVVADGPYKGLPIENGVISNRYGYPVAFRKIGEVRGEFEDIESKYVIHTFEPRWLDQSRGFPIFMACLDEFRSMSQSQDWEMQTMLIASAISLIENNETGDAGDGFSLNDEKKPDQLSTNTGTPEFKSLWGGLIRYFRANSGGKLEQFLHKRPGQDWESFNDRLIRVCCAAANWPYSLVWKKDGTNGTATRADQNIARKSIADRQALLMYPAIRQVRYAISVALQKGPNGEPALLPPYPGKDLGGFLKWGFSMPPLMTIDEGRDRDQDREDAKMGWLTDEDKALKMGTTAAKLRTTRGREVTALITQAKEIAAATGQDFNLVLNMLRQTNPNGAAGTAGLNGTPATDTPPTEEPK